MREIYIIDVGWKVDFRCGCEACRHGENETSWSLKKFGGAIELRSLRTEYAYINGGYFTQKGDVPAFIPPSSV